MMPNTREWSPLPLRLLLGIGCIHHGWHNVVMADERQAFTWMLRELGVASPTLLLAVISLTSFAGGIALLLGAHVRFVTLPLAVHVPAVLLLIHAPSGFDYVKLTAVTVQGPQYGMPGYEVSLLYLAGMMSLFFSGAGPYSLDARRLRRRGAPVSQTPVAGAVREPEVLAGSGTWSSRLARAPRLTGPRACGSL